MNDYDKKLHLLSLAIKDNDQLHGNLTERVLLQAEFSIWISAKFWAESLSVEMCDHRISDEFPYYKSDSYPECHSHEGLFNYCPDCGQKLR